MAKKHRNIDNIPINWDGTLDILDIVVTVNSALGTGFNECSDING